MAVRLNDIRVRARQRAEQEITGAVGFIGHKELTALVNAGLAELYDLLVKSSEDYFTTSTTATISGSGSTITLPSDFYKLRGVDIDLGGSRYATVRAYNFQNRNEINDALFWMPWIGRNRVEYRIIAGTLKFLPEANAPGNYRYWYVPRVTYMAPDSGAIGGVYVECIKEGLATGAVTVAYTAGATAGAEVVTVTANAISVQIESGVSTRQQVANAINNSVEARKLVYAETTAPATSTVATVGATPLAGQVDMSANIPDQFDEYLVIYAAIKMLEKEESDTATLQGEKGMITTRIMDMAADRDAGEPEVIADVRGWEGRW